MSPSVCLLPLIPLFHPLLLLTLSPASSAFFMPKILLASRNTKADPKVQEKSINKQLEKYWIQKKKITDNS